MLPLSGVYGYPRSAPHRPVVSSRLVAAALLVVAAALALGGSFGALSIYRFESDFTGSGTITVTGWGSTEEPVTETSVDTAFVLHGIPLVAAALLLVPRRDAGPVPPAPVPSFGPGRTAAGLGPPPPHQW
jgi:hypothetical protein